jgi:hypothetical protein
MVSVDVVYQKVLAIANKEQRGYITPQEFNLFADHAQKDIFRQYFYELEQFERKANSDIVELLEQKISAFEKYDQVAGLSANWGDVSLPPDIYRLGMVRVDYGITGSFKTAEHVKLSELNAGLGPLTDWNYSRPVYTMISSSSGGSKLRVYPYPVPPERVLLSYVAEPSKPNWTYVVVGESAMFDDLVPGFQDFELHPSEETLLVIKILQLAGINIKDPALVQIASQEEIKKIQQEKQ